MIRFIEVGVYQLPEVQFANLWSMIHVSMQHVLFIHTTLIFFIGITYFGLFNVV